MQPLYDHYLQFIRSSLKNDTSFSGAIPEEEQASLAALAEEHRTVPFVLPGFRNTSFYPAMLQKTKNMMQNYYQIDAFTRHTVSLLEENGIPCILLKGISLAACYPETRRSRPLHQRAESPRKSPSSPGSPGL